MLALLIVAWIIVFASASLPMGAWYWRSERGTTNYDNTIGTTDLVQHGLPKGLTWLADIGQAYLDNWWQTLVILLILVVVLLLGGYSLRVGSEQVNSDRVGALPKKL